MDLRPLKTFTLNVDGKTYSAKAYSFSGARRIIAHVEGIHIFKLPLTPFG